MENKENNGESNEEVVKKLVEFVTEQIRNGHDQSVIVQQLIDMDIEEKIAKELVGKVYPLIMKGAKDEQYTSSSIVPAAIGGVIAAVVGGIIWGLIVKWTGYEIGYVAAGIGALAGFAVVIFAKGKKGTPLQIIATFASILGILVGKYVSFYYIFREVVAEEYGVAIEKVVSIFSGGAISTFFESISSMIGVFDILWIVIAIGVAWRIPKGLGINIKK